MQIRHNCVPLPLDLLLQDGALAQSELSSNLRFLGFQSLALPAFQPFGHNSVLSVLLLLELLLQDGVQARSELGSNLLFFVRSHFLGHSSELLLFDILFSLFFSLLVNLLFLFLRQNRITGHRVQPVLIHVEGYVRTHLLEGVVLR